MLFVFSTMPICYYSVNSSQLMKEVITIGLFFEKDDKQSKSLGIFINIMLAYLVLSAGNSFLFKVDWLNSVMGVTDIVVFVVVFIWLIFFVKNKQPK